MTKFQVWTENKAGVVLVHASGTLDISTSLSLAQTMESLLQEDKKQVVVELRQLWEIDQVGLQVLISSQQQAQQKEGDVKLAELSPRLKQVAEMLELEKQFSIHTTAEEAIQSCVPVKKTRQVRVPLPLKQEIGLGDLIKKLTTALGIKPCSGCEERAEKRNQITGWNTSFLFNKRDTRSASAIGPIGNICGEHCFDQQWGRSFQRSWASYKYQIGNAHGLELYSGENIFDGFSESSSKRSMGVLRCIRKR